MHDQQIELLRGIQLFYVYWMYLNISDVKTTLSQCECKGFLNQENLVGAAKEFESLS